MNALTKELNLQEEGQPSLTFLNASGDITITWDEHNKEKIVALIKKKMEEGYTFFTTKKVPVLNMYRKVKVTEKSLPKVDSVIIDDDAFDKMVKAMDDADLADSVRRGNANLAKFKGSQERHDDFQIERDAEKVANSKALGIRKIAGG